MPPMTRLTWPRPSRDALLTVSLLLVVGIGALSFAAQPATAFSFSFGGSSGSSGSSGDNFWDGGSGGDDSGGSGICLWNCGGNGGGGDEGEAEFSVSIADTNSPVPEGNKLKVDVEVENEGDASGTQDIDLDAGALGSTFHGVSLDEGESTTVTLSVRTGSGDAGSYTVEASSDDETDDTEVTVEAPAQFSVKIMQTNAPVHEGGDLTVNTEISNTGDRSGEQTIAVGAWNKYWTINGQEIKFGPLGTDSATVSLDAGGTTQQTFTISTSKGDAGSYTARVKSDDSRETTKVRVTKQPASFDVSITGTNSPAVEGGDLTVDVTVSNSGGSSGTQTVELDAAGLGSDSVSVTLPPGASTQKTLSVSAADDDAGSYTASVSTDDDSASTDVTVEEPATFDVSIAGTNSPVAEGDPLQVDVQVMNTGDRSGSQEVTLDAGGLGSDSAPVTLDAGESAQRTLEVGTETGDAGSYTASVSAGDDSASTTLSVEEVSGTGPEERLNLN